MKRIIYLMLWLCFALSARAQQLGELKGYITDMEDKSAVIGAVVVASQAGIPQAHTASDEEGFYRLTALPPGKYNVRVTYMNYSTVNFMITVMAGDPTKYDVRMLEGLNELPTLTITQSLTEKGGNNPKLDNDLLKDARFTTTGERMNMLGGVTNLPGQGLRIKVSRTEQVGTYINGVRMLSNINFSPNALGEAGLLLGGVPVEFGDFVGGGVTQGLPSASARFTGNVELVSSSLFNKYHDNRLDATFSGPLERKGKALPIRYFTHLNYNYNADASPSAVGVWRVKENKLKELEESPLVQSTTGQGFVPRAEFLRLSDLEKVTARSNASSHQLTWVGKLDYTPSTKFNLEMASIVNYNNSLIPNYGSTLLNYANNPQSISTNLIAYATLRHQLINGADSARTWRKNISNAYYVINVQYQSVWGKIQDPVHRDNFFDYGYLGRFQTYRAPSYTYAGEGPGGSTRTFIVNGDTMYLKNYYDQQGHEDTLYTFDRTDTRNPIRSNYTERYYELAGKVRSYGELRGSNAGLANGFNPLGIYSNMWENVGTQTVGSSINSAYGKSQTEQVGFQAYGEVNIRRHLVKFGMYYEQRSSRGYNVNAMNLWPYMQQLANKGLVLDKSNPLLQYDGNGLFSDTVRYNEVFDNSQSDFAKNLRKMLIAKGARDVYGNPIDENTYVDVNSYAPEELSLSLFTADELLGTGGQNQYVNYFGYDHLGNKTRRRFSVDDFLNDPQNRSIGSFNPIYTAAYLQDRFEFRDFSVRLGVRAERFDANQPVLKDPYSLYPVRTVGEVKTLNGNAIAHPDGIGSDYKVYVDDVYNPKAIVGYRNENNWYNRAGQQIADPTILANATNAGIIQPYLSDAGNQQLSAGSFRDYIPKTVLLPRIAFDFPISTTARFFAYYDMLAQRPSNIFTPIDDYYFLRFNPTRVINNPDLKSQLTTDYEIGFKQELTRHSALGLIASYREMRNMIQLVRYNQAYPVSYISYGNIDFATVKGFRTEYELDLPHVHMLANYTLQFAEGTGSGTGSQGGLVAAGQPNLRTLFPLSADIRHNIKLNLFYEFGDSGNYIGPVINGKKVLANAGINLTLNAYSGQPYTSNALATPDAQSGIASRTQIDGTPFGNRLPWQLENNLSIYRTFPMVLGKGKNNQTRYGLFTATLWVQNFLDLRTIAAVHPYTGSATEDGWLNSPTGRQATAQANDAQSFVDLYNTALANPGYFGLPRRMRLSVALNF